jgi:hypothetical protein
MVNREQKKLKRNLRVRGRQQKRPGKIKSDHVAVPLLYNEKVVYIDYRLSWLMEAIWGRGIQTRACCQGGENQKAYILFDRFEDARKFINIVSRSKWDLRSSIHGFLPDDRNNWKIDLNIPYDPALWSTDEIGMAIWFPSGQIEVLEEIFECR